MERTRYYLLDLGIESEETEGKGANYIYRYYQIKCQSASLGYWKCVRHSDAREKKRRQ